MFCFYHDNFKVNKNKSKMVWTKTKNKYQQKSKPELEIKDKIKTNQVALCQHTLEMAAFLLNTCNAEIKFGHSQTLRRDHVSKFNCCGSIENLNFNLNLTQTRKTDTLAEKKKSIFSCKRIDFGTAISFRFRFEIIFKHI